MTPFDKVLAAQKWLQNNGISGWLLYDFRKSNDLACRFLDIAKETLATRRFFYWIPALGQPVKVVHRIESHILDHFPGEVMLYSSWEELRQSLKQLLNGCRKVVMEYSPCNEIPYVSKVDGGTIDLVRSYGIEVVSSADLLQSFTSVWTAFQLETHLAAATVLDDTVEKAWQLISNALDTGKHITEYDVQQFILHQFKLNECATDDPPICAVNANSADPHYTPTKNKSQNIKKGDFILIDLWCKKNIPNAVYADITRVGVASPKPTSRQKEIFEIVKAARDAAMKFLKTRLKKGLPIKGWEVDQTCRDVIIKAGYGQYFTHRTGHNIGERDHGDGSNIDNYETKDFRILLPGSCFSIEPGIYLPEEFGVRLEHDVYLEKDGKTLRVTGGLQEKIVCLSV